MKENLNEKIAYLELIQHPIDRIGTVGGIIKGLLIAVIIGLIDKKLNFSCEYGKYLAYALPILFFMVIDVYYLALERKYRRLYELVRMEEKDIDFDLNVDFIKDSEARSGFLDCCKSNSVWPFYLTMVCFAILMIGGL